MPKFPSEFLNIEIGYLRIKVALNQLLCIKNSYNKIFIFSGIMPSLHVRGVTELANAHPKQTDDSINGRARGTLK